jgi:predicted TPR repeat methyltransferase
MAIFHPFFLVLTDFGCGTALIGNPVQTLIPDIVILLFRLQPLT